MIAYGKDMNFRNGMKPEEEKKIYRSSYMANKSSELMAAE